MTIVAESVPGEITLMFISYLLFCTVLIYLFVMTDREWGRLEVSLDDAGKRGPEQAAASTFSSHEAGIDPEWAFAEVDVGRSLRHCAQHHPLNCSCFLQGQPKEEA
ncbi:hypothetical protein [Herbaspirillum chlorophenolicum]|jgi:hypothetical protein|uniref:hypothetical protein n=1 Tax=Herbaspirillum chlorophenolicum TaxID=211589 RepID=UPI00067A810A|nr:hypothetical protein [Herbaspirillum chlorophenolicum]